MNPVVHLHIEKAELRHDPAFDAFDVHLVNAQYPGGNLSVYVPMAPPVIQTLTLGDVNPGPMFKLERDSVQAMMDAMWKAGFRPSGEKKVITDTGMTAVQKAMQAHIDDLRRMAFGREETITPDMPASGRPSF